MTESASLRGKFTADTMWTFGAYGAVALAGAFITLFVAGWRSTEALGVFNQAYAIYIVAAQIATAGVHDSAQKHAAQYGDRPQDLAALSRAAIGTTLRTAAVVTIVVALLAPTIGAVADSVAVGRAILLLAPSVLLFGLNKTLLGILNGLRRMRAFAIAQSVRALVIVLGVVAAGLSDLPDWSLVAGFVAAELVLAPGLLIALRDQLGPSPKRGQASWRARHRRFGLNALPNSLLAESFFRIDIIMLGLLLSDTAVGVYSLAALFVEGLYQVSVVVRTVANPVLVRLVAEPDRSALARFCRRIGALSLVVTAGVGAGLYLLFPILGWWFPPQVVTESHTLLSVLLVGVITYAAFVPSDYLLLQAGLPGKQSLLMTANVVASIALNVVLIRAYGVFGAAFATALAYGFSAVSLTAAAGRWLGMNRTLFVGPRSLEGARRRTGATDHHHDVG